MRLSLPALTVFALSASFTPGCGGSALVCRTTAAPAEPCQGIRLQAGCWDATASRWLVRSVLPRGGPVTVEIMMLPNGRMLDLDPEDETTDDDSWSQDGTTLSFVFNDFARYSATVTDPYRIFGQAGNDEGETWNFTAERIDVAPGGNYVPGQYVGLRLPSGCWDATGARYYLRGVLPRGGPIAVEVTLLPGGRMLDGDQTDDTPDDDTWAQQASTLLFSFNEFARYSAVVVDPEHIAGQAENDEGERWTFTAERLAPGQSVVSTGPCLYAALPSGQCFDATNSGWVLRADLPGTGPIELPLTLMEDGRMVAEDPTDTTANDEEWEQANNTIYFYFNERFATYTGTFVDDRTIRGEASNQDGASWPFTATRR